MDRGGLIDEEPVTAETGVALATVGVEDPERRPPPWRAVAVPGDQRLRPLADDVASEADPRTTCQLQSEARGFGHGTGQGPREAGGLQHDEQCLRSPGQGGQSTQATGNGGRSLAVGDARRALAVGDGRRPVRGGEPAAGQVQHQQVHRPAGQEHAADGQALIERLRRDDHQPLQADAPGHGLDRIEAPGQVDPGDDGTRGLGFRGQPEDEGGPAAGAVTADGNTRRPWQPTGTQDRIEGREPGPDDPVVRGGGRRRLRRFGRRGRVRHRGQGEGTLGDPWSCRSPSSLEARHGCRHVRGECRHPSTIEHLFYRIKGGMRPQVPGRTAPQTAKAPARRRPARYR